MAISLWKASGIDQKMEADITSSQDFRGHFQESFWVPEHAAHLTVLTLKDHLWTSFVLLGIGLTPSIFVLFLEHLHHLYKKKTALKVTKSHIYDDPRRRQAIEIQVIIYRCNFKRK